MFKQINGKKTPLYLLTIFLSLIFLVGCQDYLGRTDWSTTIGCSILGIIGGAFLILRLVNSNRSPSENATSDYDYQESNDVNIRVSQQSETRIVSNEINKVAQSCMSYVRSKYQIELNLSPDNIEELKNILNTLIQKRNSGLAKEDEFSNWILIFGCFLGEVVRQKWGGDWIHRKDILHNSSEVLLTSKGGEFNPIGVMKEVMTNGNLGGIDTFIQMTDEKLDFYPTSGFSNINIGSINRAIEDNEDYTSGGFTYICFWDKYRIMSVDIQGILEDLHDSNFPFNHKYQAYTYDIEDISSAGNKQTVFVYGKQITLDLERYIFKKEIQTSYGESKFLILSSGSKRELIRLMASTGFNITN